MPIAEVGEREIPGGQIRGSTCGIPHLAASSSGRMPEGCPFPVSFCISARFRYEYDFTADWKFDIRSSMAHSGFESAACDLAGHLSDSL
jgi:hypothetical protein